MSWQQALAAAGAQLKTAGIATIAGVVRSAEEERLSQIPDPAQAESVFRQVYEEGQQALRDNRLADAEKAFRHL